MPDIYIDGVHFPRLSADDVDAAVPPEIITGVEVYTPTTVPIEFAHTLGTCGTILIWRKR